MGATAFLLNSPEALLEIFTTALLNDVSDFWCSSFLNVQAQILWQIGRQGGYPPRRDTLKAFNSAKRCFIKLHLSLDGSDGFLHS